MNLEIDSETRLRIAFAILDTVGDSKALRVIELPDGGLLLMIRADERVSFDLISSLPDLFDAGLIVDVTSLVEADLKDHSDWHDVMTGKMQS